MAAVTICSDFGAPQNEVSHCFHCFPIYLPWSDGTRCHDLSFLNVELIQPFHSPLSLSSVGSSSLFAIGVVSSAYLRLLIFLPAVLIPTSASSSPTFLMMYSEYKLNKQGDNVQPWCTPFPIWNQSVLPCPVLTVAYFFFFFLISYFFFYWRIIALQIFAAFCQTSTGISHRYTVASWPAYRFLRRQVR